jgi:iron complex outermembrane receptor protein
MYSSRITCGRRSARAILLSSALVGAQCLWSSAALAQQDAPQTTDADQTSPDGEEPQQAAMPIANEAPSSDIVVTGTLLKGVAPVGTNVLSVSRSAIVASGVTSSNDLLADIPQVSNFFNSTPKVNEDIGGPTLRPNIRNLPLSGGATTLVLLNAQRLVGVGILQTVPDVTIIPPGALERVEVVPDGGSSTYGSDAIGGVINFITRHNLDGLEINGKAGLGDHYKTADANVTFGKTWDTGSFLVSYQYAQHTNIEGRFRDYVTQDLTGSGGQDYRSTACGQPNVIADGVNYALPSFTAGSVNRCDNSDYADIYPSETRHSVFASFSKQLNDSFEIGVDGLWSTRLTTTHTPQSQTVGTITDANPYFRSINGETLQTVRFGYDPILGREKKSYPRISAWELMPHLSYDFGQSWELKVLGNYGRSYSKVVQPITNPTAQEEALAATDIENALNPYNLAATNPAVLDRITDWQNYADSRQELISESAIADGELFSLPGGAVHLAFGGENRYEWISAVSAPGTREDTRHGERLSAGRTIRSAFGELLVPVFGPSNGFTGMERLELSASVRYDHYSDVGSTTNPKFGVTYKPFHDLSLRGNYGTSFNAPSLADTVAGVGSRAIIVSNSSNRAPGSPDSDFDRRTIIIAGGNPDLVPQTANTYSIGGDYTPSFVPGLRASLTYYYVKFKNAISLAPYGSPSIYTIPGFKSFYTLNPTIEQTREILGNLPLDGLSSIDALYANGQSPYVILDARRNNLGSVTIDGLDFNLTYNRATSFGSVNAAIGGTYTLDRHSRPIAGAELVNDLATGTSRLQLTGNIGATVGRVTGQLTAYRSSGFKIVGYDNQNRLGSFTNVDLYLACRLNPTPLLKETSVTLNVDNLFGTNPPFLNAPNGYGNGSTLGRVVSIGIRTKL